MKWKLFLVCTGIAVAILLAGCVDSFSPTGESDPKAPTILETFPADKAADVAVDATMQVTFSEAIDPASVNAFALWVQWEQNNVEGALTVSEDGSVITFTPSDPLREGATYQVYVSRRITDVDGIPLDIDGQDSLYGFSFTVGETIPYVVSVTPADNATGVSVDTAVVTVEFSEAMDPASINSDTIFVYDVDGATTWDSETFTATFTLLQPLAHNTRYTIGALKQITDQWGIPMEEDARFSFVTETGLEDGDLDAVDATDEEMSEADGDDDAVTELEEQSSETESLEDTESIEDAEGIETETTDSVEEVTGEEELTEDDQEPAAEAETETASSETGG
jgi:hypothetical protein